MRITTSLDVTKTLGYLTYLAGVTGKTLRDTFIDEGAAIYKLTASKMKVASQSAIKRDVKQRVLRKVSGTGATLYQTKAGRIWYKSKTEDKFRLAGLNGALIGGWRLNKEELRESKDMFKQGKERVRTLTAKVLQNRGLAAGSFVKAVESLGLSIDSVSPKSKRINQAVKAQSMRNNLGSSLTRAGEDEVLVVLNNISKIAKQQGGRKYLSSAIATRLAFFKNNIKRGVLLNAAEARKAYPGSGFTSVPIPPLAGS